MGQKRWWLALAICLGMLGGCGGSGGRSSRGSFGRLITAGTQQLNRGHYRAAAGLFERAAKRNPTSPVPYYDLGVDYGREGRRGASLVGYAKALNTDPRYVPALYNYGVAYESRDPQLAIYFFRKVIHLQPDSPSALLQLGLLMLDGRESPSRGLGFLKAALKLEPSIVSSIPRALRPAAEHAGLPKGFRIVRRAGASSP